jgi:hypothetical protein
MRFKMGLIIMVFIMAGKLSGNIKVAGRLLIPAAGGVEKSYQGVLTITRAVIRIECYKKIFQPFNEFDAPKQTRLNINTSEVVRIEIDEREKKIYLRVENSFVQRYRNIINLESRFVGFSVDTGHLYKEFWAIIFAYEKPLDIGYLDEQVLNSINQQAVPVYTKHCFYSTGI